MARKRKRSKGRSRADRRSARGERSASAAAAEPGAAATPGDVPPSEAKVSAAPGLSPLSLVIDRKDAGLLALLLAFFVALKTYGLNLANSDENIYFYDVKLMTEGYWPYRSFFFAHPPMHLIPGWLVSVLTGFSIHTLKAMPIFAVLASGSSVYLIARRAGGRAAAVVAMALFLFNHDMLRASSHWTGINWSVAWMSVGALAALHGRERLAGVLLAVGALTGMYVVPACLMVGTLLALWDRKRGLSFAVTCAACFFVVHGAFWLADGDAYLDGVLRYHLEKPEAENLSLESELPIMLFHDFFVLAGPAYALGAYVLELVRRPEAGQSGGRGRPVGSFLELLDPKLEPRVATLSWAIAVTAGYLFFLSLLGKVFHFYFLLLFPFASVAMGLFVAELWRWVQDARAGRERWTPAVVGLAAIAAGVYVYPRLERLMPYYDANAGKERTYEAPKTSLPPSVDGLIKGLFFSPVRVIGDRYTGIQHYLWHESRTFEEANDIAAYLKEHAGQGDTLIGDSTIAPLVALLADLPIADRFVDTNAMRFRSGMSPAAETIQRFERAIDQEGFRWVVTRRAGFMNVAELSAFIDSRFETVRTFTTRYNGNVYVMHLRGAG